MHDATEFLHTLAIVLCAAAVTTVVFQRLRQPVVLGYLLAGVIVGPHVPIPIHADTEVVKTLAELGVILLMFSLGIEFSLSKLVRVGPTATFVTIVQCSLLMWLGYLVGQAWGWSWLQSLYAGAAISISSTTIIVKAFEEQRIKGDFTQIVFGILIMEDLVAILLISVLTALSSGEQLTATELGLSAGRLALFLTLLFAIGFVVVPRLMRSVVSLHRHETTVVASIGLAFGLAYLASSFGYSVALGAFIAGALVAESGVEKRVEHLVQPVRDIFAAIFFVSVGMLIEPLQIAEHWPLVLTFFFAVVLGNIFAVTLGALLTGQSIQTSVKTGMSLAQIGEFSFIIAGVGIATGATDDLLYSVAVAVSGLTTLLTPWLIRAAEPTAEFIDRKLPRAMQTFIALYGTWIETLKSKTADGESSRVRRSIRWLLADAMVVAAIVISTSLYMERIREMAQEYLGISPGWATALVVAGAAVLSAPFWIGMVGVARFLGYELALRAFPAAERENLDMAAAPRRLLVVTLQLAIVLLVGFPLVAITQPFLPVFRGAAVLFFVVVLLAFGFWRGATNLQGHARAAAQALAEALAASAREARANHKAKHDLTSASMIFTGLGSPVPIEVGPTSPAVGRTLAEIKLRGLTGATVLAIRRAEKSVVVPSGEEQLQAGDVLAVAGTHDSVEAAKALLTGEAP
jgi:CPA2 family monovalent cation:H+ antiporter-2